MTTDATRSQPLSTVSIEPLYFRSGDVQLFGCLHGSAHSTADMGVLLCEPFGYEAICSHRALVAFAQAAASLGIPVLRFNYRGTGDSDEIDPRADQLLAWSQDVVAAVAELQRRTGVRRVCLLGFRLGALLASLAAAQCEAVAALIAIAPVVNGRKHLRELRTIQMAASTQAAKGASQDAAAPFEVSGFTLSAATLAALSPVDLTTQQAPAPDMLIIDRSDLPSAKAWGEHCTAGGARVQYQSLQGFVRMMMTAPDLALIPHSMIAAMKEWLKPLLPAVPAPRTTDPSPSETAMLLLQGDASNPLKITERPVILAASRQVFAIVTEPHSAEVRRRGVILLNAGATHHIGPNRMYVTLARRWARRGCVVLRLDLAGLGDSTVGSADEPSEVFPPTAIEDIGAAIEFMRIKYGVNDVTLGGLCAGAYHALRAAAAALPLNRIMMVNPLHYHERPGITRQDLQWLGFVHNPSIYRQQALPNGYWQAVKSRRLDVRQLLKLYAQHAGMRARRAARRLHLRISPDLGSELEQIAARGVDMVFMFGSGEPGIGILKNEAGASLERLGPRCRIHVLAGADHIFSDSTARAALEELLSEELFARHANEPPGAAPLRSTLDLGGARPADQSGSPIRG
jgi:pimeloyl-ACP methyl ester carboxylesterase